MQEADAPIEWMRRMCREMGLNASLVGGMAICGDGTGARQRLRLRLMGFLIAVFGGNGSGLRALTGKTQSEAAARPRIMPLMRILASTPPA
jgi:hypothetical protein